MNATRNTIILLLMLVFFGVGSYNYYSRHYIDVMEMIANIKGRPWEAKVHVHSSINKSIVLRNEQPFRLKAKDILNVGDYIITDKDAVLVIKFGYSSALKLMPDTRILIDGLLIEEQEMKGPKEFSFQIVFGSIFMAINKGLEKVKVRSLSSTVKVKGTEFIVTAGKEGNLKIAVLHGMLKVKPDNGDEVSIESHQGTMISNKGVAMAPDNYRWVEAIRWKEAVNGTDILLLQEKIKGQKGLKQEKDDANEKKLITDFFNKFSLQDNDALKKMMDEFTKSSKMKFKSNDDFKKALETTQALDAAYKARENTLKQIEEN